VVEVLGGKPEVEVVNHRACGGKCFAKGVVLAVRDNCARFVDVVRDVAVIVVERGVPCFADAGGEQSADAARAPARSRKVFAPDMFANFGRAVGAADFLEHGQPAVEEENMRGGGRCFNDAPVLRVVGIGDKRDFVGQDGGVPVLGVPCQGEVAI